MAELEDEKVPAAQGTQLFEASDAA